MPPFPQAAASRLVASLALLAADLAAPGAARAQGLLVVSQGTGQVLEYDAADGSFVAAFVEPVSEGFQNPGGMALRPSDGVLHVSSAGTGEIWRHSAATGAPLPPAAASGLIQPGGVALDASGAFLYVLAAASSLSSSTDSVQRLTLSSGALSTLVTDASASFSAIAPNGSDLYVSDTLASGVRRYSASGSGGALAVAGLSSPAGLLFPAPGQMLIADAGSDQVLEYTLVGSAWVFSRVVLPASAGVDGPAGLALAPDGRLSVSGQLSDQVVAVDLATLVVSPLVAAGAGGLDGAGDVAWSGGQLFVLSRATNSAIQYDAAGSPTGVVARGITPPADSGMALSPAGDLLVGSLSDNDLAEYDGQGGGLLRRFFDACPTSFASPFDVAFGPDGNVYVSCSGSEGVFRFDAASASPLGFFVGAGSGGLQAPRGLAFGPNGNLFVASGLTGEVLEYDGVTGAFAGLFVDASGNGGGPVDPHGLAFHGGSLYVASFFPSQVMEFDADSGLFVRVFVASGAGGLSGPTALAFGPGGDLFVASFGDDAVRRYDGTSGAFVGTFVASGSGGLDGPIDLAFRGAPAAVPAAPAGVRVLLALLLGALGLLALLARREPAPGPAPVPMGSTVEQALPDAEGRPETWRLSKRTLSREELPALVLPRPAPRRAPPGPATESARALAGQALEAWKHGEIERALELFESAVAADPEDAPPRSDYGRLLMLMADYEAALPQLERAAELRPDDPRVWVDLLTFYERTHLFERAGHARRRAEELAGGRSLERDETGFWVLEGEKIFP